MPKPSMTLRIGFPSFQPCTCAQPRSTVRPSRWVTAVGQYSSDSVDLFIRRESSGRTATTGPLASFDNFDRVPGGDERAGGGERGES